MKRGNGRPMASVTALAMEERSFGDAKSFRIESRNGKRICHTFKHNGIK